MNINKKSLLALTLFLMGALAAIIIGIVLYLFKRESDMKKEKEQKNSPERIKQNKLWCDLYGYEIPEELLKHDESIDLNDQENQEFTGEETLEEACLKFKLEENDLNDNDSLVKKMRKIWLIYHPDKDVNYSAKENKQRSIAQEILIDLRNKIDLITEKCSGEFYLFENVKLTEINTGTYYERLKKLDKIHDYFTCRNFHYARYMHNDLRKINEFSEKIRLNENEMRLKYKELINLKIDISKACSEQLEEEIRTTERNIIEIKIDLKKDYEKKEEKLRDLHKKLKEIYEKCLESIESIDEKNNKIFEDDKKNDKIFEDVYGIDKETFKKELLPIIENTKIIYLKLARQYLKELHKTQNLIKQISYEYPKTSYNPIKWSKEKWNNYNEISASPNSIAYFFKTQDYFVDIKQINEDFGIENSAIQIYERFLGDLENGKLGKFYDEFVPDHELIVKRKLDNKEMNEILEKSGDYLLNKFPKIQTDLEIIKEVMSWNKRKIAEMKERLKIVEERIEGNAAKSREINRMLGIPDKTYDDNNQTTSNDNNQTSSFEITTPPDPLINNSNSLASNISSN